MMEAMSVEEISSVIAHELGHLSRKHNRVTFWFFKLWQLWDHLVDPHSNSQGKTDQSIYSKDSLTGTARVFRPEPWF